MFPSWSKDDCDDCVPDYLRKQSAFSTVVSLFPFASTFAIVGGLALVKLFPRFSDPTRQPGGSDKIRPARSIWSKSKVQMITALTFSLTIALSAVLTELILCEISNSFSASARKIALNAALPSLLLLLVFFLPLLELYSVISSAGWRFQLEGRKRFRMAWILQVIGFGAFALAFWTIGIVLPGHSSQLDPTKSLTSASSHTMIEGSLERLGVAGVTLMALLSGFAAVSSIWQTFNVKSTLVTENDLSRKESGLDATRDLLDSKRDRRRALRKKLSTAPEPSLWSKTITTLRPNLDVQEMKALEMEISGLEAMADSLELSLSVLQSRYNSQVRSKTPLGRILNLFNYLFSLYCVYRVITTTINLLRRLWTQSHGLPSTDPITMFIALFAKHINPALDQNIWAHHISFFLSSVILITSFSAVVQTIHLFSRITPRNLLHAARSNAALVIAQICGTYVISSALMLRATMPEGVRNVINDALGSGSLDAGWVQKWFDSFFIAAVVLTGQGLWIGRKIGREDWDEETWEGDMEGGGGKRH